MHYTKIFKLVKSELFRWQNVEIFLIFAQNIDCGYTLEPPRQIGIPLHTSVLLYKRGVYGVIHNTDILSSCTLTARYKKPKHPFACD